MRSPIKARAGPPDKVIGLGHRLIAEKVDAEGPVWCESFHFNTQNRPVSGQKVGGRWGMGAECR